MEINEVKLGDMVTFTHKKKKVTGKVIYRHQDKDKAALMGHVNVQVLDGSSYPMTVHVSKLKPALKEETNMKNLQETRLENTMDLIDLIDNQNHVEAENKFNELLQDKIDAILGVAKEEVAKNMFNTQECAECEEQNEEVEVANEALKGNQHKIDANKNGKIDAHDFKLLRGRKTPKTERMDRALAKRVENNKKMKEEVEQTDESVTAGLIGAGVGLAMAARGASRAAKTPLSGPRSGTKNYLKNFAKGMVGMKDKPKTKAKTQKEEVELDEASYSAKMARAGKDIGKPGKMFSKIAKKASRKYGKERGAKIAGAVLAKLRKKGK